MTTVTSAPRPTRNDRVPLGIVLMLGATAVFATSQAISKWQVASYSFAEVLFFRAFVSLVTCAVLILPRAWARRLPHPAARRPRRAQLHPDGGAELHHDRAQPDADSAGAMAINFSAPLFATLFAAIWLKERVGAARAFALARRLLRRADGRLPRRRTFRIGALFAIANAVLYGSVTAAVRGLSATESAETLTMYQMVFLSLFFGLALTVFGFTWPGSTGDWIALTLNGVVNGIGQYWWTRSLSMAPPAAVGPFYYFTLVWAMVLGFVFWGDIPSLTLLAGSSVVVGSGLFLLWHESGKNGKKPVIEPAEP